MRGLSRIDREQIVAGECGVGFRRCRAPTQAPVAQAEVVNESGNNENRQKHESGPLDQFLHDYHLVTKVPLAAAIGL
jgi:hypothetical protein